MTPSLHKTSHKPLRVKAAPEFVLCGTQYPMSNDTVEDAVFNNRSLNLKNS